MNNLSSVYAYETEDGHRGLINAPSHEIATDKVEKLYGCELIGLVNLSFLEKQGEILGIVTEETLQKCFGYLENKKINHTLKGLFPDCTEIKRASGSQYTHTITYGRNGEALELQLFHSEDNGDAEYHLNVNVVDKNGENVFDQHSYDATVLLKPNVEEYMLYVKDGCTDATKVYEILKKNGITVKYVKRTALLTNDEYEEEANAL